MPSKVTVKYIKLLIMNETISSAFLISMLLTSSSVTYPAIQRKRTDDFSSTLPSFVAIHNYHELCENGHH